MSASGFSITAATANPYGGQIVSVTPTDTITIKAQRVAGLAAQLQSRLASLECRLWPTPPTAGQNVQAVPTPEALPWLLEKAEADLKMACDLAERISTGI